MLAACLLDRLVGDPRSWLHPVQVIGWTIALFRRRLEPLACGRPWALRIVGLGITLVVVGLSAAAGWCLERWLLLSLSLGSGWGVPSVAAAAATLAPSESLGPGLLPGAITLVALASALAGRSLEQAVEQVLRALPPAMECPSVDPSADPGEEPLRSARQRLAWIVGRDTEGLDTAGILRALAETASENAVDGLFAPLFWMLVGALLWQIPGAPGPLCLAWAFKAASTLDSMLGYRRGTLLWLGTAGARLDDILTWLPCRLVAFSLPLVAPHPDRCLTLTRRAFRQGAADPSPNSGVSQAIYALMLGLQLGGESLYAGQRRFKPVVGVSVGAAGAVSISATAVRSILGLSRRLQLLWLLGSALAVFVPCITKTLI
ncbi:MAG: CobD/CbiB family cobalamin biosynthesis protein [Cyanobacteriota bacterium]